MIDPIVQFDILQALRRAGRDVVIADVRWYLDGRDGRAAYEVAHLPDAIWVDLEHGLSAHGQPATAGRHPLPTPQHFADAMGALGIGSDTAVLAYDDTGGLTAGRLVVMLRMLGHDAALLDGGLPNWIREGRPIEVGPGRTPEPTGFPVRPWPPERLVDADAVAAHVAAGGVLIDARPHERFTGELVAIDPRPGHIPGATSAPWSAAIGPDGRFRSPADLRAHYAAFGGDPAAPHGGTVAYCGSGVSACVNIVAMEHAGFPPPQLFTASFSGWSADHGRAVEIGA